MEIKLRKIGNSQGIILPDQLLKQCDIQGKVKVEVVQGKIIISPVTYGRETWTAQFEEEAAKYQTLNESGFQSNSFDDAEWTW